MAIQFVKREKEKKSKHPGMRFLLRAGAIFFTFIFLLSAVGFLSEYRQYSREITENEVAAEKMGEGFVKCEPSDKFSKSAAIQDDAELMSNEDRLDAMDAMEGIYDNAGISNYLFTVPEDVSVKMNENERTAYAEENFEKIAETTSDQGKTANVVTLFVDGADSSYYYEIGDSAKKTLSSFEDSYGNDFNYRLSSVVRDLTEAEEDLDGDDDENFYAEWVGSDLAYYYTNMDEAFENPYDYYTVDSTYLKQEMRRNLGYSVFSLIMAAANVIFLVLSHLLPFYTISFQSKKEEEKKEWEDREAFLERSLESFEDPGVLSAVEDVDNEKNPYHDLVEKYGGFEEHEAVSKEEPTEGTPGGLR